jgi:hypothetical protein
MIYLSLEGRVGGRLVDSVLPLLLAVIARGAFKVYCYH